jgi:hypothetical protein
MLLVIIIQPAAILAHQFHKQIHGTGIQKKQFNGAGAVVRNQNR